MINYNLNDIDKNVIIDDSTFIGNFNTIKGNVRFGKNVKIGNCCTIEGDIFIDDNTEIFNNVNLFNKIFIGKNNKIYSNCCLGFKAQHLSPHDINLKSVKIGDNNTFRENSTVHLPYENEVTVIGNSNFFMVNTHISHDSIIKNNVIIANNVAIGGHSVIGNFVNLGLNSCLHQFTRIGDYAMVGMGTSITKDVLPFHLISGSSKGIKQTINFIGFSRNYRGSITSDDLVSFRNIIRKNKAIDEYSENMELREMIESFIKTTKRGVYFD